MGNTELMAVDDMLNAVGLAGVLFYFLSPTIIVILGIYTYNRIKARKKLKERRSEEGIERGIEILSNEKEANKKLGSTPDKPEDIHKFRNLTLNFDKSGHATDSTNKK